MRARIRVKTTKPGHCFTTERGYQQRIAIEVTLPLLDVGVKGHVIDLIFPQAKDHSSQVKGRGRPDWVGDSQDVLKTMIKLKTWECQHSRSDA